MARSNLFGFSGAEAGRGLKRIVLIEKLQSNALVTFQYRYRIKNIPQYVIPN